MRADVAWGDNVSRFVSTSKCLVCYIFSVKRRLVRRRGENRGCGTSCGRIGQDAPAYVPSEIAAAAKRLGGPRQDPHDHRAFAAPRLGLRSTHRIRARVLRCTYDASAACFHIRHSTIACSVYFGRRLALAPVVQQCECHVVLAE